MAALPNIRIEEFHAAESGLIIFYSTLMDKEVREIELTKHEAARLMLRSGWLDDVDIYQDTVVVRFETVTDDVNHSGNHVQRIQKMVMEWDEFRLWVTEKEVRDVVKLYLKDQHQHGSNGIQSRSDQDLDQEQQN